MKVFVPITDEMLDKGLIPDDLVAYQAGRLLLSQLQTTPAQSRSISKRSPISTPNSAAVPAFNSSTNLAGSLLG